MAVNMSENDPLLGERRSQLQGIPPETQVCSVSGNRNNGETADGSSDVLATLADGEYSKQGIPPEIQTIRRFHLRVIREIGVVKLSSQSDFWLHP